MIIVEYALCVLTVFTACLSMYFLASKAIVEFFYKEVGEADVR